MLGVVNEARCSENSQCDSDLKNFTCVIAQARRKPQLRLLGLRLRAPPPGPLRGLAAATTGTQAPRVLARGAGAKSKTVQGPADRRGGTRRRQPPPQRVLVAPRGEPSRTRGRAREAARRRGRARSSSLRAAGRAPLRVPALPAQAAAGGSRRSGRRDRLPRLRARQSRCLCPRRRQGPPCRRLRFGAPGALARALLRGRLKPFPLGTCSKKSSQQRSRQK